MNKILRCCIFLSALLFVGNFLSHTLCSPVKEPVRKETYCAYTHFLNAQLEKVKGNDETVIQEYEKAIQCDPSSFYLRKERRAF